MWSVVIEVIKLPIKLARAASFSSLLNLIEV
jgi:hypothetical protein